MESSVEVLMGDRADVAAAGASVAVDCVEMVEAVGNYSGAPSTEIDDKEVAVGTDVKKVLDMEAHD